MWFIVICYEQINNLLWKYLCGDQCIHVISYFSFISLSSVVKRCLIFNSRKHKLFKCSKLSVKIQFIMICCKWIINERSKSISEFVEATRLGKSVGRGKEIHKGGWRKHRIDPSTNTGKPAAQAKQRKMCVLTRKTRGCKLEESAGLAPPSCPLSLNVLLGHVGKQYILDTWNICPH